ncbi:MAG TPA: protein kinase [Bryobacteraceae bacterium]
MDAETQTLFMPGTVLGPYRIEGLLGSGGMGQVFRGVDTRLGRPVAIKLAHGRFGNRFEREAQAISALNHPHICTLYDVGAAPSGPGYLVMELVQGETLAARLKKGALPMNQVLRFGAEIADALAAAHAKGIIHRDLKPGNIMLARSGVKVLDFGLARSTQDETLTFADAVIGTPAYMAPEQREGRACDARTDIYALGLILTEMATGKRQAAQALGGSFGHIVERCLADDPENRWQSAHDVKFDLEWAAKAPAGTSSRRPSAYLAWIVAMLGCVAAFSVGALFLRRPSTPPAERTARFVLSLEAEAKDVGADMMVLPAPDGKTFVYSGTGPDGGAVLWLRPVDSVDPRLLPGTQNASLPFWSPDGRWIGFYADGKLKKISPAGGSPVTIASLPGFQDPVWGAQGDILYRTSNRTALYSIRDSGGAPRQVTQLNASLTENSHRFPWFLPDGRRFLFTSRCAQRDRSALYIASLDNPEVKRVMALESEAAFVPTLNSASGALFYYRDGSVVVRHFDPDKGEVSGEPVAVMDGVDYAAASIHAYFRVSADGSAIVIRPTGSSNHQLTWFSRDGSQTATLGPPGSIGQPRISPDGSRVAFDRPDDQTGNRDVWSLEIARGILTRLTLNVANDWYPVWSPDSKQLLFGSDRGGGTAMPPFLKESIDAGSEEAPLPGDGPPFDWSRDGKWISLGRTNGIWIAPTSGDRAPFKFLANSSRELDGRFSPDGKWIAYSSNESGRSEVYVRPFHGAPASAEGKVQISNKGGDYPVWGPSGQELFFMAGDSNIYAADTRNLGRTGSVPLPSRLFRPCPETQPNSKIGLGYEYNFDTRDGENFLVDCLATPPGRFVVLLNWPGLK